MQAEHISCCRDMEVGGRKRKLDTEFLITGEHKNPVVIKFEKQFIDKKYRFFEVSQQLLADMASGCRLVGDETVDVVLCTSSKTYSIKRVETSNSMYLVPPSSNPEAFSVAKSYHEYYEVSPTSPRIDRLKNLLALSAYSGKENEENPQVKLNLLKRNELPKLIQASDDEIQTTLAALNIIEINGYIRLVDEKALQDMSSYLLDTIMENRWDIGNITFQMCLDSMDPTIDIYLLRSSLNSLSSSNTDIEGVWKLDYGLVSRNIARKLFRTRLLTQRERIWPADDFLLTWSINVPSSAGEHPPLDCLSGLAIRESDVKRGKTTTDIFFFIDVNDLSSNIKTRFRELFQLRQRYSIDEIKPYLKEFYGQTNQPKTIHELLLQHTLMIDGYYHEKLE